MYLKPFLVIQALALLTTQIWAYFRLRAFGLEFMSKLEALAASGYTPIPLPHEMSEYLRIVSLMKAGTFFTFTLGFTLGIIGFGGSFLLNRYRLPGRIRVGWTILITVFFSFVLGFSPLEFLLLAAFFGIAHMAVKIPDAPFHKVALLSLIPFILILFLYHAQGFLLVRDSLLQKAWGRGMVSFYYRYSPLAAELITPLTDRIQVAVWTNAALGMAEKSWLLKKGIYTLSTREGADLALPEDVRTGPAVLKSIERATSGKSVKRLRKTLFYSIFVAAPLGIMLLSLLVTDSLLRRFKHSRVVLLASVICFSGFLAYHALSEMAWEPSETLPGEKVEEIRQWVFSAEKKGGYRARDNFVRYLGSNNPAVRVWAATALAHLPSKENVEILAVTARQDPLAIVRCKAIFALSHQGERRVIPFLESRLKGPEDWYVKHYLVRALRRLGWVG